MTEQDLWIYRDAMTRMYTTSERLREYESTLLSPSSPNLGKISGNTYRTDRMTPAVSYLEKLRDEKEKAEEDYIRALTILDKVYDRLPHISEKQVLELRYRQAREWGDIAVLMNIAKSTVFDIRLRILQNIAGLDINTLA